MGSPNDDSGTFILPWEHHVCLKCFESNPNAIWLVKQYCFKPHFHKQQSQLVAIDREAMKMVSIRPLPFNWNHFKGGFVMCNDYQRYPHRHCAKGQHCRFTHSQAELDSWNAKKTIKKENPDLYGEIQINCGGSSQSPTFVCQICLDKNPKAVWLAGLTCIRPEDHSLDYTTVVVSQSTKQLIVVRSGDHLQDLSIGDIQHCKFAPNCWRKDTCKFAHSWEELISWKWKRVKDILCSELGEVLGSGDSFVDLYEKYEYPTEKSPDGIKSTLTTESYKSKYHKLVYLDDLEHTRKMVKECDGDVTLETHRNSVHIVGMANGSAAVDYAIQNHAAVDLTVNTHSREYVFSSFKLKRDIQRDSLVVEFKTNQVFQLVQTDQVQFASAHFEINHWYFQRLHHAIHCVDSCLLNRLVSPVALPADAPPHGLKHSPFKIDKEYQYSALKNILSCRSGSAPSLIIGPFGTGKTHVLAATVAKLLMDGRSRVLVCTYQNNGADNLYQTLVQNVPGIGKKVLRLVPDRKGLHVHNYAGFSCASIHDEKVRELVKWPAIVTTFLTALTMKDKAIQERQQIEFTHIILDEGAQSREPEALGALVLATPSTRIVIAGDHRQVGPQVSVYSSTARTEGLGLSILERLYSLYKEKLSESAQKLHVSTLLTNYRCHPSILMLASSLLYNSTLLSRSISRVHPKAPYPLVFECSSISRNFVNVPAESKMEASLLVSRMFQFILKDWPLQMGQKTPHIGLLASTRQQVTHLRKEFRKYCKAHKLEEEELNVEIMTTYTIQGEEFDGVFLSTMEPTDERGRPRNPVRSACNEYVFNTIVTRSRSLLFTVGNPFLLCKIGSCFPKNAWVEYIRRCIVCDTITFPNPQSKSDLKDLPIAADQLCKQVLLLEQLEYATNIEANMEVYDAVLEQYKKVLGSRREQEISIKLLQDPTGMKYWKYGSDSDREDRESSENVVLVEVKLTNYREGEAVPQDQSQGTFKIDSLRARRGALPGDIVKYDKDRNCILLDERTERANNEAHFGSSFLCRVNPRNPTEFFPLDNRYPKFINLPTLTKTERDGVVCFDPTSLNESPKMNNFIPSECAVNMLFIVKFLRWRKEFTYPLGIIVGALPFGTSMSTGQMLLKISHGIPFVTKINDVKIPREDIKRKTVFDDAITIDPIGSIDHDDALTCKCVSSNDTVQDYTEYEIGVHIADVQKFFPKEDKVDKLAFERGCSVYSTFDGCACHMLPEEIVTAASLNKDVKKNAFSVVAKVTMDSNLEVHRIQNIKVMASQVIPRCELTYQEAQAILNNRSNPNGPLKLLWKVSSYLRRRRLGEMAAYHLSVSESDEQINPEAHRLVEELMIWANVQVVHVLHKEFPGIAILRSQPEPEMKSLEDLKQSQGSNMAVSLDLQQYVSHEQLSDRVYVLCDILQKMQDDLQTGSAVSLGIMRSLHCVQFEHLHPQVAVSHALFNEIRAHSVYCTLGVNETAPHHSLKCEMYTRFTSPIRRYVDLVNQRQLYAIMTNETNPYTLDNLKDICKHMKEAEKRANSYDNDIKKLQLACQLRNSSQQYICFVTKIEKAKLQIIFVDRALKPLHLSIDLKNLNALSFPFNKPQSASEPSRNQNCSWKVKVASASGSVAAAFDDKYLRFIDEKALLPNRTYAKISYYSTGEEDKDAHLSERRIFAEIEPFTHSISGHNWRKLQGYLKVDPEKLSANQVCRLLTPDVNASDLGVSTSSLGTSPLWIYTINRPLQSCEVLRVQLTAGSNSYCPTITPSIQLVEVGPNLQVCVQHSMRPAQCFTDKPTAKASRKEYKDIRKYFEDWEQVFLAEAATSSVGDSEFLLVKDVSLTWPKLLTKVNSKGEVYHQLQHSNGKPSSCVCMKLPKLFATSSYEFFRFSEGDLVCVRCNIKKDDETVARCVFHMIVQEVEEMTEEVSDVREELVEINVYLKFVGQTSNYISPIVEEAIQRRPSGTSISYEVQLIGLTVPHRRIYGGLRKLQLVTGRRYTLAQNIAIGKPPLDDLNPPPLHKIVTGNQAHIATILWNSDPSLIIRLNQYQIKALTLACSNRFVMIQGPPGTGKSVTGAHMAYALAMKLRKERGHVRRRDNELNPCVMYCGPSQQSVNVVLDVLTSHKEVYESLKIVRVYSKAIEKKEFPGPNCNPEVFKKAHTDGNCDEKFKQYALHHIIREKNADAIKAMDSKLIMLNRQGRIPSAVLRRKYTKAIQEAESTALKMDIDIVLCTCNEASSYRIANSIKPIYCIVDECAMAMEPECMLPIRQAEHVVLIGDHNQLQPVINNREAEGFGLGISLFERYVKSVQIKPHMLQLQYRMHEAICEFPSNNFYGGALKTDPSVQEKYQKKLRKLERFWPRGSRYPFVFCDIIGSEDEDHTGQKETTAKVGLGSKRNNREAKKIVQIAKELVEEYKIDPDEIAALTPYSAQREEIRKEIERQKVRKFVVKTITDSQGSEFGIVLLSTVRSQKLRDITTKSGERLKADIGWLTSKLGFITDPHQICVGITRCKYGLVIVGNKTLLQYDRTWNALIDHYHKKRCVIREARFPKSSH